MGTTPTRRRRARAAWQQPPSRGYAKPSSNDEDGAGRTAYRALVVCAVLDHQVTPSADRVPGVFSRARPPPRWGARAIVGRRKWTHVVLHANRARRRVALEVSRGLRVVGRSPQRRQVAPHPHASMLSESGRPLRPAMRAERLPAREPAVSADVSAQRRPASGDNFASRALTRRRFVGSSRCFVC